MPELPEVETIARQLNDVIGGKKIESIQVLRQKSFPGDENELLGETVEEIGRRAKVIIFKFKNSDKLLTVHLKMTGQLIYISSKNRIAGGHPTADWIKELPSSHTRVVLTFDDKSRLFFNDMRVFGWMRIISKQVFDKQLEKKAPDVIDPEFTVEYLSRILSKTARAVKQVLMDQEKIGGVGNIYANDALYLAGIHPQRAAKLLTPKEVDSLWKYVREVINKGIKYGGASASDDKYVNLSGLGGKYQEHFLVYEKNGDKCKVCGSVIEKIKIGGRGTYLCPVCQK
jgi:formamidopyrimidine-DNA glycosylase